MKKNRLLVFVPLVLVLSSCNISSQKNVEIKNPFTPEGTFIEDTKAHDELFNSVGLTTVRKSLSPIDSSVPSIGIQRNIDNKGTVDESDDTVSVRFVAAVAINGDLGAATASWTRAIYTPVGFSFKDSATRACTTAYTALATAGNPFTIADYNSATGGSYTHFVAYTMRNIPLNDYASYYFTAYLTLNDGSGETVSKMVATTIDQTTQFSLNASDTGRFLIKHTNSGFEKIEKGSYQGGYHAEFEGVGFAANESFIIVEKENSEFHVYGYDKAHIVDPLDTEFIQDGTSQFLKARYERNYFVILNDENRISVQEVFPKTLYFKPNANWNDANSKYVVALKYEGESEKHVYELNKIGNTNTYTCDLFYNTSLVSAPVSFYKLPLGESLDIDGKPHTPNIGWPLRNDDMLTMNNGNNSGYWSLRTEADPVIETGNFTITDFVDSVEIHTDRQKQYLAYEGDYTTMATSDYPDGNAHISDSLPVEVDFDFAVPGNKELDHYSVVFGKEADLSDGYEVNGNTNTDISFYNPFLGKNYYKLVAHFTDSTTEESQIHNFYVDATCPRNLTIAGMTNCRDLGGRLLEDGGVIKQGLVYRTSGRNQSGLVMTEATTEEMIHHLGLKNEIYLAERGSSYACSIEGATLNNIYMDYSATDGSSNFSRNTEPLKKFFAFMADSNNYPVYFHCKIGTDRTGLCATMLCGLLGVPLNEIYQDYLFSNFGAISGKRYIGEQAGHDNILRYTEYIQSFSGKTFKNKVYNALLSIGVSKETLNAVINNLTDGPRATGNDNGQLSAFGDQLTAHGVEMSTYDNSLYSNDPAQYYTLYNSSTAVSYTFNIAEASEGQVVAYLGNGDNSTSTKIGDAITMSLDNVNLPVRDISFRNAGMGYITTTYQRYMYYPVILGSVNFTAGEHTIKIKGIDSLMNIAGITVLDAVAVPHIDGGSHAFGDWQITTPATCSHGGEKYRECSCGVREDSEIAKLDHNWGDAITINPAGTDGIDEYISTTVYNCSSGCNTSALRWSALDFDTGLSDNSLNVSGSYIRFASGSVENRDGAPSTGSHAVYKINVSEAVANAGLSFRIQNTNGSSSNAPVFRTISGDSSMGAFDNGDGTYTTATHRYGLRVNGVEYYLGDDNYGNQVGVSGWFDWPVSFPVHAGVNTIDVFAYAGYRAYMYEFQLTGLPHVENVHQHQFEWHYDESGHWKVCVAEGCPFGENTRFEDGYHNHNNVISSSPATCEDDGYEELECACGHTIINNIYAYGHNWVNASVTVEPTCTEPGERTLICSRCSAETTEPIAAYGHDWDEGIVTTEATCASEGEKTVTCSRCGTTDNVSIPKIDHDWGAETIVNETPEPGQVSYYQSECSHAHATRLRISATSGTFGENSSNKAGTPDGFIKLNGNGQYISYTFNYAGPSVTAKIYQRAIFDSWTSAGNKTSSYSSNGTGVQGCNFSFYVNGLAIDMTAVRNIQYQTMFENGEDTGLGSSYSLMANCLIGEFTLLNGENTFTYTRLASMNLLVHDYIIVIES